MPDSLFNSERGGYHFSMDHPKLCVRRCLRQRAPGKYICDTCAKHTEKTGLKTKCPTGLGCRCARDPNASTAPRRGRKKSKRINGVGHPAGIGESLQGEGPINVQETHNPASASSRTVNQIAPMEEGK